MLSQEGCRKSYPIILLLRSKCIKTCITLNFNFSHKMSNWLHSKLGRLFCIRNWHEPICLRLKVKTKANLETLVSAQPDCIWDTIRNPDWTHQEVVSLKSLGSLINIWEINFDFWCCLSFQNLFTIIDFFSTTSRFQSRSFLDSTTLS